MIDALKVSDSKESKQKAFREYVQQWGECKGLSRAEVLEKALVKEKARIDEIEYEHWVVNSEIMEIEL